MPPLFGKKPGSQKNGNRKGFLPPRMNFFNILIIVVLIFLLITGIYSQFSNETIGATPVSLSALAQDVQAGKVKSLTIQGDQISADYFDKSHKKTQKESDASLT